MFQTYSQIALDIVLFSIKAASIHVFSIFESVLCIPLFPTSRTQHPNLARALRRGAHCDHVVWNGSYLKHGKLHIYEPRHEKTNILVSHLV